MAYPRYDVPSVAGISFGFGGGAAAPLEAGDSRLSVLADAFVVLDVFHKKGFPQAHLVNAATDASLNQQFDGLDANSPYQPWWIKGIDFPGYAGNALAVMWKNGRNHPGEWSGVGTGNVSWADAPEPVAPTNMAPVAVNPADAAAFAALQGSNDDLPYIRRRVDEIYNAVKK